MRQSKRMSLLESIVGTVIGLLVALLTQMTVFPMYNIEVTLIENFEIGLIFTVVSLMRSYIVRRVFNRID